MIILFDKNSSVKILFLIIPVDLKITTLERQETCPTALLQYGYSPKRQKYFQQVMHMLR